MHRSIGLAIFLFFCILTLSALPAGIIRGWAQDAVFGAYSKNHIKKIKKDVSFWGKFSQLYLIGLSNTATVKRRVLIYWLYFVGSFCLGVIFGLSALGVISYRILKYFMVPKLLLDVTVYVLWAIKHGRYKRTR